jgi:hypothetical protein
MYIDFIILILLMILAFSIIIYYSKNIINIVEERFENKI